MNNKSNKRVLLIGASGLLGRQFSAEFFSQNYEVLRIGNSNSFHNDVRVSLHEIESLRKLLHEYKPTHVINSAWVTSPYEYRNSPQNRVYMDSSVALAKLCVENKVLVYVGIGTSAEYGSTNQVVNCEIDRANPINKYGFYKQATFRKIQQSLTSTPLNFLWLRIFQAYGPGEHEERLIPSLINSLSRGECFTLENPSTVLDFITSRDVAKALLFCLEHKIYGCVDVGTSRGTSVQSLAELVRDIIGRGDLIFSHNLKSNSSDFKVVSPQSKLFKEGWSPKDNLVEGLKWVISSRL